MIHKSQGQLTLRNSVRAEVGPRTLFLLILGQSTWIGARGRHNACGQRTRHAKAAVPNTTKHRPNQWLRCAYDTRRCDKCTIIALTERQRTTYNPEAPDEEGTAVLLPSMMEKWDIPTPLTASTNTCNARRPASENSHERQGKAALFPPTPFDARCYLTRITQVLRHKRAACDRSAGGA
jgi:hypothetical protein